MTVEQEAVVGRRDRKKQQTRAALTLAALQLVAERGLDAVTVEDISDAADVCARTFFNYFACKDDALTSDSDLHARYFLERLVAVPTGVPTLEAIRLAFKESLHEVQAQRELWLLRTRVIERNPSLLPRLVVSGKETERAIVEAIAVRIGVDPDSHGYPLLVTGVLNAASHTVMARWIASHGKASLTELVDEVFTALAAGLPDPRPTM
ncbi:acyl-CoA-like ligand-binding transcription factor [Micromonospora sp. NPDC003197]